ncbi:MAG: hypothetical protein ABUT39_06105 [Acidobacteriota bacterium]
MKIHVVVAGASQWGQNACAQILHRVYAHGGRVTLIVARRFEERFTSDPPAASEWKEHASLRACIEDLRDRKNQPIDYIFDDQLQHLAMNLLRHRSEYRRLGYVATGGDEHYRYARVLASCCDRVLVEKPVSKMIEDVRPGGRFETLMAPRDGCAVYSCEHFAFRKGFTDAKEHLVHFVRKHRKSCGSLRYEFRFFEPAEKEALRRRSSAMQDGSILDVAITHGLGPLAYLMWRVKHPGESRFIQDRRDVPGPGLHDAILWESVEAMQARDRGELTVPVLAETAVRIQGTYSAPGEPPIRLLLESGKGGSQRARHFRVVCEVCEEAMRREDHEVFAGVSLGPAGYSISDFPDTDVPMQVSRQGHLEIREADQGWNSDLLAGGSGEAENAQAAMLEAFIAPEVDERFLSINEACQIVRLGIEAQALAFLGTRGSYSLEKGVGDWEGCRSVGSCSKKHEELKTMIGAMHGGALDQLTRVLGSIRREEEGVCCRVVSVLGAEGLGNTDLANLLQTHLSRATGLPADLLYVRRDERWARGEGSGDSTVARLLRDLAQTLSIASAAAEDLVGDLRKRILRCWEELEKQERILIFNGIDRLGSGAWEQLTRLLNELPPTHRIVFITNRGDRASGLVFGSREVIRSMESRYLKKARCFSARQYRRDLRRTIQGMLRGPRNGEGREALERSLQQIERMALGNATVERQLCSWLRHVVLAEYGNSKFTPDGLAGEVRRALASIAVPPSVTPDPERLLDRISQACLAELTPREEHAVSVLARLPDGVPGETLDSVFPRMKESIGTAGPMASLFDRTPDRGEKRERDLGPFVFFPRVRRMAMRNLEREARESWEVRREIAELRLLSALPEDKKFIDARLDRLLALGDREDRGDRGLGRLDLDGTPLEELCIRLIDELEIGLRGRTDGRSSRLLSLLARRPTNLGMSARARLLSFYSWSELGTTTKAEEIVRIMNRLAEACDVAEGAQAVTAGLNEAFGRPALEDRETRAWQRRQEAEAHRSLLVAELLRAFTWDWMFGLDVQSRYVFGRKESLRQAERLLRDYLDEDDAGRQDPETTLLKAQSIAGLALFYAWSDPRNPAGARRPRIEESYLHAEAARENREVSGLLQSRAVDADQVRRLQIGTFLSLRGAELCEEAARAEETGSAASRRIASTCRRSGGFNLLNGALLYGILARMAKKAEVSADLFESRAEELVERARKSLVEAWEEKGEMEEPYYFLTCARLTADGALKKRRPGKPRKLAAQAEEGYRRRAQDYFAELAVRVNENLGKAADAADAAGGD